MILDFDRGDASAPVGHAILYFRSATEHNIYAACYLVVPPIEINLSRYMPPMFAGHMPPGALNEVQAVPLPPVPERVSSLSYLQKLSDLRQDDLINGGTLALDDMQRSMLAAAEAAQQYLGLCRAYLQLAAIDETSAAERGAGGPPLSLDVNEVLYDLMGEHDRLMELAKLIGKLRYAVDGGDRSSTEETVDQMERLLRHLPDKFRPRDILEAARRPGPVGQKLAELYVDRCFKLSDEDYRAVGEVDRQINDLSASS
jgi:hypothetical protein